MSRKKAKSSEPAAAASAPPAASPSTSEPAPAALPSPPSSGQPSAWAWAELGVVVAAAVFSLGFYATLPSRLPSEDDYQHLAQAIRADFAAGDAIATAPEWAERAREVVHGLRFVSPPDLTNTDLSDVRRLWLVGLPSVPRSDTAQVTAWMGSHLSPDGELRRFGNLTLQRYVNPGFREPLFSFTRELALADVSIQAGAQHLDCPRNGDDHRCPRGGTVAREVREIDFAPHECVGANAVGRPELVIEYPSATLGKELDLLAGITGEMGWKHSAEYTAVKLTVDVDGARLGELVVPAGTVPPQKLALDTSSIASGQPHRVRFAVTSDNPKEREFCFDARAY